jgi:hypothetical protein
MYGSAKDVGDLALVNLPLRSVFVPLRAKNGSTPQCKGQGLGFGNIARDRQGGR